MAAGITEAELLEMVIAMDVMKRADAVIYSQYLFTQSQAHRAELVALHYETIKASMTGIVDKVVLKEAERLAAIAADSLIKDFIQAELNAMGKVIAKGLKEGLHPFEVAKILTLVDKLDGPRGARLLKYKESLEGIGLTDAQIAARVEVYKKALLEERRKTIARTEMRRAIATADTMQAAAAGAKFKVWQSTGDAAVSEECEANEAQGPIPIADGFTGGVDVPPQHPNCRCSVSYVFNDLMKDAATERAKLRAAKTAAAKELQGK